jgi:hypothetical protein
MVHDSSVDKESSVQFELRNKIVYVEMGVLLLIVVGSIAEVVLRVYGRSIFPWDETGLLVIGVVIFFIIFLQTKKDGLKEIVVTDKTVTIRYPFRKVLFQRRDIANVQVKVWGANIKQPNRVTFSLFDGSEHSFTIHAQRKNLKLLEKLFL